MIYLCGFLVKTKLRGERRHQEAEGLTAERVLTNIWSVCVELVRVDQEDLDDSGSELQAAQAALTEADGAHCSEERVTGRKHVDDVQRTKP